MQTKHKPNEKLIATYYNFSPGCLKTTGENPPPFFSRFSCQTCGDSKAGARYYCTATIGREHTNPRETLEICEDCYLYFFT